MREVVDLDLLKAFHDVEVAAQDHDFVALPADPIEELVPLLDGHQPAGEHVTLYVWYDGDAPVANASLCLWVLDNLTSANLELHVHPDHRRRGHGRTALLQALDAVRAAGRTRVFGQAPWTAEDREGPAWPLLRSLGAKPVLDDVRRLLDLRGTPLAEPLPAPEGYRVVQWVDRAPDELVDGVAYLNHRMVLDAPMGDMDYEPEVWDAARVRRSEEMSALRQRTRVTTAVLDAAGTVVGMTSVMKNAQAQDVAYQWETIVDPDHRGHRLGTVLKTWNHRQLVDRFPEVRWVNTWNAASNTYMVAVNEALGFRPAERWTEWQLDL